MTGETKGQPEDQARVLGLDISAGNPKEVTCRWRISRRKEQKKNKGNNALMNVGLVQSGRPVSHKGNVGDLSSRMKETIVPRGTIALTNEKVWVSREKKKEKQRERRYRQRDRKSPLEERSLSKEREMKVEFVRSGQGKILRLPSYP